MQGVLLGGEDGEGLRDELAHHHVQGRHDEEAHGHADGMDGGFGQAQGQQRAFQHGGYGRLAEPADGQGGQGNAQLASGQVGVDVGRHIAGRLSAAALFGHGHIDLAAAHAHQRELGHDEKRVHQQEQDNEQQAKCGIHTVMHPFGGFQAASPLEEPLSVD